MKDFIRVTCLILIYANSLSCGFMNETVHNQGSSDVPFAISFEGGTLVDAAINGGPQLELDANGLTSGLGSLTSKIYSTRRPLTWNSLSFTTSFPTGKPLPNSTSSETGYDSGNADMTSNLVLYHFEESTYDGTASEVADSALTNHATSHRNPSLSSQGRFGKGLNLSAPFQSVTMDSAAAITTAGAGLSFEFWFKPQSTIDYMSDTGQALFESDKMRLGFDSGDGSLTWSFRNENTAVATGYTLSLDTSTQTTMAAEVFNGYLYQSFGWSVAGYGDVWVCNPGVDEDCDTGDWTLSYDGAPRLTFFLHSYKKVLYVGHNNTDLWACRPWLTGDTNVCEAGDWAIARDGTNGNNYFSVAMVEYRGNLYLANLYYGIASGDVLYCTPDSDGYCGVGATWNTSLTGAPYQSSKLIVFKDRLYLAAGFQAAAVGLGDVYRCDPESTGDPDVCETADWSLAYDSTGNYIYSAAEFNGRLYIGYRVEAGVDGDLYVCDPGADDICSAGEWTKSLDSPTMQIRTLFTYRGQFFAGFGEAAGQGDLYVCTPGSDGICNTGDWATYYDSAAISGTTGAQIYKGRLYISTHGSGDVYHLSSHDGIESITSTTKSWTAAKWYHLAGTYDNATQTFKLYVNGVEDSSYTTSVGAYVYGAANVPLRVGASYGSNSEESFTDSVNGVMDEFAFYSRTLSASEVLSRYKRGASRVKIQVRACDDSACSGETYIGYSGDASTYFDDSLRYSTNATSTHSIPGPISGTFFQYKVNLEVDTPSSFSPVLKSLSVSTSP